MVIQIFSESHIGLHWAIVCRSIRSWPPERIVDTKPATLLVILISKRNTMKTVNIKANAGSLMSIVISIESKT